MLGGADNPNGELLSYIIGADSIPPVTCERHCQRGSHIQRKHSEPPRVSWRVFYL